MSRSPKYESLRGWILGRIRRHCLMRSQQNSMPAHMLDNPPEYLLADMFDARDELRALRDEGVLASVNRRWYFRPKKTGRAKR